MRWVAPQDYIASGATHPLEASTLTPRTGWTLGLARQIELDFEVQRAPRRADRHSPKAAPLC